MQLIKLSATDSTNSYLRRLSVRESVPDFTVVQAVHQTAGRGQPGTQWVAEEGKNLTFSILKRFESFPARNHFLLNMGVSLSVFRLLESLGIPELSLKWPNDIMSGSKKVCGILVENQLQGADLSSSIIGIGLNVNQTGFGELPGATSLRNISGKAYDLNEVLLTFISLIQKTFEVMSPNSFDRFLEQYQQNLYLKDQPVPFGLPDGTRFIGTIHGTDADGRLKVSLENGEFRVFGFKEIRYLGEA